MSAIERFWALPQVTELRHTWVAFKGEIIWLWRAVILLGNWDEICGEGPTQEAACEAVLAKVERRP